MNYKILLLLLVVLVGSFGFLTCSDTGTAGQSQQLPNIYRFMDPSYLEGDWYLNQTFPFDMRYFFNHLVIGMISLFNNLDWALLILHSLSLVIFYLASFLLADLFFNNKKKAFFITFVLFVGYPICLGSSAFFKGNFSPNGIAWSLIIVSLYLYFERKNFYSFCILGFAALFNLADTLPVAGILLFLFILSSKITIKERAIRFLTTLPFFLVSAVLIVPLYLTNKTSPALSKFSSKVVTSFYWKHIFPSSWTLLLVSPFLFVLILFIYLFNKIELRQEYRKELVNIFLIIMAYCFVGFIFVEIFPITTISKMMLFRITKLITFFGYFILGSYVFTKINHSTNWLEKIFYLLFPISFRYPFIVLFTIPLFFCIEIINNNTKLNIFEFILRNRRNFFLFSMLGLLLVIFLSIFLFKNLPSERTSLNLVLPLVILPSLIYLIGAGLSIKRSRNWFGIAVVSIVLVVTVFIGPFNPIIYPETYSESTKELFDFLKSNTKPEESFLISIDLLSFKSQINRSTVVGFMPFTDIGIAKWYLRIKDISGDQIKKAEDLRDVQKIIDGYRSLNEEKIKQLKEKYGFDYVIFLKPKIVNLPIFYQNKEYIVYQPLSE